MEFGRRSGVFAHVTSLPGPHGVGDLGNGARSFLSFLSKADQSLWQFCPLGPTSGPHDHSPYSTRSSFAGNPLLLDLTALAEQGWIERSALPPTEAFDEGRVDFKRVSAEKEACLRTAFDRFDREGPSSGFEAFREREAEWLADYALFEALKAEFDGASWLEWPGPLRRHDPDALSDYREALADAVRYHEFVQWRFDEQWRALRAAADEHGIDLVGDLPMYVALDSADVWAHQDAFAVDEDGPTAVAGVPPNPGDDGQNWGMPVYEWDHLAETGYRWWLARLRRLFDLVDVARLDHFKAFDEFWAIPADGSAPSAGEWRPGPGEAFFEAVRTELGSLPFLVEDLGFIDGGVEHLRDCFSFPGMRVPQYADWCAERHRYKPGDYPESCVAYTSTHDTDTVAGYYADLDGRQRECLHYALGTDGSDVAWDVIDAVWNSEAAVAMTTVPDLLGAGSEARFNTPGTGTGNWRWRFTASALEDDLAARLEALTLAARR
jgi:4-alpha-glucanotransferase